MRCRTLLLRIGAAGALLRLLGDSRKFMTASASSRVPRPVAAEIRCTGPV